MASCNYNDELHAGRSLAARATGALVLAAEARASGPSAASIRTSKNNEQHDERPGDARGATRGRRLPFITCVRRHLPSVGRKHVGGPQAEPR